VVKGVFRSTGPLEALRLSQLGTLTSISCVRILVMNRRMFIAKVTGAVAVASLRPEKLPSDARMYQGLLQNGIYTREQIRALQAFNPLPHRVTNVEVALGATPAHQTW
jgi:hypothetical protein